MKYYFDGHDTDWLDSVIRQTIELLDRNDNHLKLKNGDDIIVYADGDDWTIIDDPEYGGGIRRFNLRYMAIIEIIKMSRRGL